MDSDHQPAPASFRYLGMCIFERGQAQVRCTLFPPYTPPKQIRKEIWIIPLLVIGVIGVAAIFTIYITQRYKKTFRRQAWRKRMYVTQKMWGKRGASVNFEEFELQRRMLISKSLSERGQAERSLGTI
jgi:hypothetical protein